MHILIVRDIAWYMLKVPGVTFVRTLGETTRAISFTSSLISFMEGLLRNAMIRSVLSTGMCQYLYPIF